MGVIVQWLNAEVFRSSALFSKTSLTRLHDVMTILKCTAFEFALQLQDKSNVKFKNELKGNTYCFRFTVLTAI